jgi:hypothetical protein
VGERGKAMSGHPDKIAEHYRELAAEEVALAKAAVTNEARAKHYAMRLSIGASHRPQRMKSSNDHQVSARPTDDARQHAAALFGEGHRSSNPAWASVFTRSLRICSEKKATG